MAFRSERDGSDYRGHCLGWTVALVSGLSGTLLAAAWGVIGLL